MITSDLRLSRDRFLTFARRLALVTGCVAAPLAACGGGNAGGPGPTGTPTAGSASTVATSDPTSGMPKDGPCRCSWDTNAEAAPRVCKKGEENYEGVKCVPGGHPTGEGYYPPPPIGPLSPPDLPA